MKKIGFSGTLDPITNGHMWVIGEARAMAEQVLVFLSENTLKKPQFSAEERKRIIELSTLERGWDNVEVQIVRGEYTARAAKQAGVDYLIRGIRNTADFDYENLIQQTNVDVLHGAKSIFVMPPRDLGSVSSSFVRALQGPVGWHWHMRKFVPWPAYEAWVINWLYQEWQQLWQGESNPPDTDIMDQCFHQLTGTQYYGAKSRYYHNLDHLVHGLTEIRVWANYHACDAASLRQLKKAFWMHDVVYHQAASEKSDEEQSAQWWLQSGLCQADESQADESQADESQADESQADDAKAVADLIRCTDHFQQANINHALKQVMLGADLAILGQDKEIYDMYAAAIRAEFAHVPLDIYVPRRCHALQHFCQRAEQHSLYLDSFFDAQYNDMALSNMRAEIAGWKSGAIA
jgi:pantetheine-phosphate adenylyltransferase